MGFGLDSFIDKITNSNTVYALFNNPIWSAILIVSIILLTIYFIFRDTFDEENSEGYSFVRLLFRAGIYISIIVFTTIALHYKTVSTAFEKKCTDKLLANAVSSTTNMQIAAPIAPAPAPTPITPAPAPIAPAPAPTPIAPAMPAQV